MIFQRLANLLLGQQPPTRSALPSAWAGSLVVVCQRDGAIADIWIDVFTKGIRDRGGTVARALSRADFTVDRDAYMIDETRNWDFAWLARLASNRGCSIVYIRPRSILPTSTYGLKIWTPRFDPTQNERERLALFECRDW